MEEIKQTISFVFIGKIRKSKSNSRSGKEYESYILTIPKQYIKVYGLDKLVGKNLKITMNIEDTEG